MKENYSFREIMKLDDGREKPITYSYRAEGNLCNTNNPEEYSFFRDLFNYAKEQTNNKIGDKIYTIRYDEGYDSVYMIGEVIIFDTERLFKEIFNEREEIASKEATEKNPKWVMRNFLNMLKEKGIEYEEHFMRMD